MDQFENEIHLLKVIFEGVVVSCFDEIPSSGATSDLGVTSDTVMLSSLMGHHVPPS